MSLFEKSIADLHAQYNALLDLSESNTCDEETLTTQVFEYINSYRFVLEQSNGNHTHDLAMGTIYTDDDAECLWLDWRYANKKNRASAAAAPTHSASSCNGCLQLISYGAQDVCLSACNVTK